MTDSSSDDGALPQEPLPSEALPQAALARLTELRELAAGAVESWEAGDRQAAYHAMTEAVPAVAAAAAVLGVLVETGSGREEYDRRPAEGPVGHWWG
ncbi:hypothetical protein [Kitasatospora sp. KL5]|uniref:hypothetical protein n=1 Tax=Kitasatospora sp. KL5 TaxID=3425125 RepID=UPI003D70160E